MFNPSDNLPCLQVFAHFPTDIDYSSWLRLEEQKRLHECLLRQLECKYSTLRDATAIDSAIDYRNHFRALGDIT